MQENNSMVNNIWLLIVSLILMVIGVYMIFNPASALLASAIMLGILFILMGIGYAMLFKTRHSYAYPVIGIFDILIGIMFLTNLGITTASMPFIFGFWCLFVGVTYLIEGMRIKKSPLSFRGISILTGMLGIIFGVLVFLYPIVGVFSITFLLGTYLIICGAFEMGRYYQQPEAQKPI